MAKRWLFGAGLCIVLASSAAGARADTIELLISRTTGDVSLHNPNAGPFSIVGYSIETSPGTLNSALWTSIADTYDASGDLSVDVDDEWIKLSSPGSTSNLAEGTTGEGSLMAGQFVNLGPVWNTSVVPDPALSISVGQPGVPPVMATVVVSYYLGGDYNGNDIIDTADYAVWRDAMAAGATVLPNDPTPGLITEDDFLTWRQHFGESLGAGVGAGLLSVATVPEPATGCLLIAGGVGWWIGMRRRSAPLP